MLTIFLEKDDGKQEYDVLAERAMNGLPVNPNGLRLFDFDIPDSLLRSPVLGDLFLSLLHTHKPVSIDLPELYLTDKDTAQMAKMIAFSANLLPNIVVRTNSLAFLYTINNCIVAFHQWLPSLNDHPIWKEYPISCHLSSKKVDAYIGDECVMFSTDNVMNDGSILMQIDEGRVGKQLGQLQTDFNYLFATVYYVNDKKEHRE